MIHAVRRVNNNFELLFTARQLLDSAGLTRKQLKIESTQRYKSTIAVETYGIEPENVLKVAMCMEGVNYA